MTRQIATVVSQAMRLSGTGSVFCAMPVPPALTPALALDYVRELSADVRAGVVLDALGRPLAGPPALIDPVRGLLAAAGDANQLEAATAHAVVCAVRSPVHSIVVLCGRFAIPSIVRI